MNGCSCEIEVDHDNGPEAFSASDRTARKPHKCGECRRTIEPGEVYRHESGVWDGGPSSHKTCVDCVSIREVFFCGYVYGAVLEKLIEHIEEAEGQIGFAPLPKLTPRAREMVCGMVEDYWREEEEENPLKPAMRLDAFVRRKDLPWWKERDWIKRAYRGIEKVTAACFDAQNAAMEVPA